LSRTFYTDFLSLHYTDRKKDRILDGAEDFEQYRGKKLNAIHYRSLKPYGVSIENPDSPVTKKAAKFANGIHIPTKPKVIRNEITACVLEIQY
jgi:hypothetical protein